MSQEWKWRVGVDTEQASQAFDDLARRSQEADDSLQGVVQVIQTLETHLANLNQIGASGLGGLAEISDRISAGFTGVDTQLTAVISKLTRLIGVSSEAAQASSSGWGRGATAVERYSERLAEAELQLGKMQRQAATLGAQHPTTAVKIPLAEEKTVQELIPSLEEYRRLLTDISILSEKAPPEPYAATSGRYKSDDAAIERRKTWEAEVAQMEQRKYDALGAQSAEAEKYVGILRQIAQQEGTVAQLVAFEARERQKAVALAREQAAATPEGQMSSFFTEPGETDWGSKFGLGEMTGFEQSLLKVLTMFDQLRISGRETQVSFAEIVQTIEHLGSVRLQPLGTSIRTNIRTRLEEGTAAAELMIQTLERLNTVQVGDKGVGVSSGDVAPSMKASVPIETKAVVAEVETMSQQVSQAFDEAPAGAERATGRIRGFFQRLKKDVVGGSIVPDMVREINMWLEQIGGLGSLRGIEGIGQKFLEVQREMQQMMLLEEGGLPGFGEQRQEVVEQMIKPYRESLQAAQAEMSNIMGQASASQWQTIRAPTGQNVPVPPSFVQELSTQETEKHKRQIEGLTSSEEELAEAAKRVATSLWGQAKVSKDKAVILEQLKRGTINAAQADEQLAEMNKNVQGEMKKTSALSSRFVRHIAWIFQGIVIWGAIRAMQDWVGKFNEGFTEIEMQAAHAAFIVETSTERMMDAQRSYAGMVTQYGVGPTEAAPVLPLAERYGMADPRIAELSAQLSMVADEEMSMADAANYLMSVMRQWNMTVDESSRVMDTLATMYAHVPGTMSGFLDLMREGPALAEQMGQSFEENMLLISRAMSFLPGRTATTVSGTMGRMLSRVYRQDAARKLAQEYGISVYDPETLGRRPGLEVLDDIAQKFRVIKSESEKAALAEMVAGARQGQAWKDAYVMLENWTGGIRDAQTELVNMDTLVDKVADTHKTALEEMKASWELLFQTMGQSTGIIGAIDKELMKLSDRLQGATRQRELFAAARGYGLGDVDELTTKYAGATGESAWERSGGILGPLSMPVLTDDFTNWLDDLLKTLPEPGTMFFTGAGEDEQTPLVLMSAMNTFAETVNQAGENFSNEIESSADMMRKALLVSMIATGWTPGTGVVDLSEYSTAQINKAQQQSASDTQRMVGAYRQFLQGEGFGGEAIEKAMQEFTNKLMLQLQFFRLPGNQIRLMEGRDLLFYLSQIEENTRPLEGIWNVPEGMRVWVPIESTFYGNWRDKQGEAGAEDGAVLDSSAFDASSAAFGAHVDEFGVLGRSVWQNMRERLPTQEEGGTLWDERQRDFFTFMQWLQEGREGRETDRLGRTIPTEGADAEFWNRFGGSADKYASATDKFVVGVDGLWGLTWEPAGGAEDPRGPNAGVRAMPGSEGDPEIYLPLIMKGIRHLYPGVSGPTEIDIPQPMDVSIQQSQISTGVAIGTIQTGMPISMMSMAMAQSAAAGAMARQLFYLMLIAGNTAQPTTTTVVVEGGTATTTTGGGGGGGPAPPAMTDWLLGGMPGVEPT